MPTNRYFNYYNDRADQRLMDDLINECVQIHGIDAYYMPRSSMSNFDPLFGDDPTRSFTDAYPVEVYVQSVDQFEGGELFSKFGLEVKKQAKFLVTRRSFHKNIPRTYVRPREGDIVWMSNFKAFFEIKYVDEEHFFYPFGNNNGVYGYSMLTEKWNFAQEKVDTGNLDIDDTVHDKLIVSYTFFMGPFYNTVDAGNFDTPHTTLLNGGNFSSLSSNNVSGGDFDITEGMIASGTYKINEVVFQTDNELPSGNVTASATVIRWDFPTGALELGKINGVFLLNRIINGSESLARWTLNSDNIRDDSGNRLDNNEGIHEEASSILNWGEHNPFGEPQR